MKTQEFMLFQVKDYEIKGIKTDTGNLFITAKQINLRNAYFNLKKYNDTSAHNPVSGPRWEILEELLGH